MGRGSQEFIICTIGRKALVAALLATTALPMSISLMEQKAFAQSSAQTSFNVPAGPLSRALAAFGSQSGTQISYDASIAAGKTSPGIRGAATREQALAQILQGSGLSYSFSDSASVVISDRVAAAHAPVAADGSLVLDTIDVNAGGSSSNPADEPYQTAGSSSYISQDQIQRIPPSSVGDVFKNTPGVLSADNRNGVAVDLNIRGLQGMNRNAVMVDGTMQNNSMYTGYRGNRDRVYVDPDLLGGVRVEKGPSGGEYGAGVIGGVVDMRTLEASDIVKEGNEYGIRLKGGFGSNTITPQPRKIWRDFLVPGLFPDVGTLSTDSPNFLNGDNYAASAVAAVDNDRYEFIAGVARRKQGNYFAGKNGDDEFTRRWMSPLGEAEEETAQLSRFKPGEEVTNTSQDSLSALVKGKAKFDGGHSFELGYVYYDNSYGEASDIGLIYGDLSEREPSHVTTNTLTARYAWTPDDNPLVDFHVNAWAADARNKSPNIMNVPFSPTTPPQEVDTESKVLSAGGEVWNRSRFDEILGGLTVKYGSQYYLEDIDSHTDLPFGLNDMNGQRAVGGIFTQAELAVTDWLTLSGSARYDFYRASDTRDVASNWDDVSDRSFSPTAGITITPWDGIQFYGLYSQGWRPPSLRELMFLQNANAAGMNHLEPEVAKNFEFGMNVIRNDVLTGGDALFLKASYFDNLTENYIARMGGNSVSYNFYNVESVRYKGIELSARYELPAVFGEVSFTYYTDAEYCMPTFDPGPDICDDYVKGPDYGAPYIPPKWAGTVTLGTRMFEEKLTLGSRLNFAGRKLALVRHNYMPDTQWDPYLVVDLFGTYRFNDKVKLDFSAENIFDTYYLDALSRAQIPSPGRTIRASLTANF